MIPLVRMIRSIHFILIVLISLGHRPLAPATLLLS